MGTGVTNRSSTMEIDTVDEDDEEEQDTSNIRDEQANEESEEMDTADEEATLNPDDYDDCTEDHDENSHKAVENNNNSESLQDKEEASDSPYDNDTNMQDDTAPNSVAYGKVEHSSGSTGSAKPHKPNQSDTPKANVAAPCNRVASAKTASSTKDRNKLYKQGLRPNGSAVRPTDTIENASVNNTVHTTPAAATPTTTATTPTVTPTSEYNDTNTEYNRNSNSGYGNGISHSYPSDRNTSTESSTSDTDESINDFMQQNLDKARSNMRGTSALANAVKVVAQQVTDTGKAKAKARQAKSKTPTLQPTQTIRESNLDGFIEVTAKKSPTKKQVNTDNHAPLAGVRLWKVSSSDNATVQAASLKSFLGYISFIDTDAVLLPHNQSMDRAVAITDANTDKLDLGLGKPIQLYPICTR
jgi:hypothetical protein